MYLVVVCDNTQGDRRRGLLLVYKQNTDCRIFIDLCALLLNTIACSQSLMLKTLSNLHDSVLWTFSYSIYLGTFPTYCTKKGHYCDLIISSGGKISWLFQRSIILDVSLWSNLHDSVIWTLSYSIDVTGVHFLPIVPKGQCCKLIPSGGKIIWLFQRGIMYPYGGNNLRDFSFMF